MPVHPETFLGETCESPVKTRAPACSRASSAAALNEHSEDTARPGPGPRLAAYVWATSRGRGGTVDSSSQQRQVRTFEGRALPRPDEEIVDQGLTFDIATLLNRRQLLRAFGIGAAAVSLAACSGDPVSSGPRPAVSKS